MLVSNQFKNNYFTFKSRPNHEASGYAVTDIGVQNLTPREMYNEYKNGERFFDYKISIGCDKGTEALHQAGSLYLTKPNLERKKNVLDKEREMLYEELEHPELTLARNYENLSYFFDEDCSPEEIEETITCFNIGSLKRIEELYDVGFPTEYTDEKMETLKKVFKNADESTEAGILTRKNIIEIFNILLDAGKKDDSVKESVLDFVNANSSNEEIISMLNTMKISSEDITDIEENIEQPTKFKNVLLYSKKENKTRLTNLVERILTEDDCSKEVKQLAVWGAGKYRSDKSFEVIKNIALDTNEEDITMREFAINSTALYLRENPEEVVEIMDKISQDGTIFAPLGQILKDKVTGNYHNQKERGFNYLSLSEEDRTHIHDFINRKIEIQCDLNPQKTNTMYENLGYYLNAIKNHSDRFVKTHITDDTYTKVRPRETEQRMFDRRNNLNNGMFIDSILGINTDDFMITSGLLLKSSDNDRVIGHEFAHQLNKLFDDKDNDTLKKLYEKAKENNSFTESYGRIHHKEYFAVGMEAYMKPYVPHSRLLSNEKRTSRYNLMEKDPELYNFIEEVLQKY